MFIDAKIKNFPELQRLFKDSPKEVYKVLKWFLYSTKKSFVGSKKTKTSDSKLGSFGRQLMRRKHAGRGGNWERSAASAFKGFVTAKGMYSIRDLRLGMGAPQRKKSGISRGFMGMDSGGYNITSSKFMPAPVWKNLSKLGIHSNVAKARKSMLDRNNLISIRRHGKVLMVYKPMLEGGSDFGDAIMFVGKKSVKIPGKRLNFEQSFERRLPGYLKRGQKRIDKLIERLNK